MTTWLITTDGDGVVSVRRSDVPDPVDGAGEFTMQAVPVAGALLDLDVAYPEQGLRAFVADRELAVWWLPFVFGEEAAAAVVDAEPGSSYTVESDPGELEGLAVRLLTGHWLRRWWPSGRAGIPKIEEWLLEVELGTLALHGDVLFTSEAPARALLEDHVEVLAREFARYRESVASDGPLDEVGAVLFEAVQATLESVPDTEPGYEQLVALEEKHLEEEAEVARATLALSDLLDRVAEWARAAPSDLILAPTRDLAYGLGGEASQGGSVEIDWAEVHPRSVLADHGRWTLTGDVVRVEIDSERGSIPVLGAELYARVRADGHTWAISLEATPFGFAGERDLPGAATWEQVEVTVYSDRFSAGGRTAASTDLIARRQAQIIDLVRKRVWRTAKDASAEPFAFELRAIAGA
jgi:hypothetical protein